MTLEQHNKYLGYSHLAYAAFHSLMGLFFGAIMLVVLGTAPTSGRGNEPPAGFFILMACLILVFTVGWTIPSMIAAYGLLKRKRWAKVAGIVAGVFAATQMPVGTAVCVYTFWFLFSENGRQLYDRPAHSLPPAPPADWASLNRQTEETSQYKPPISPPDWR
jgi:hypothetical protein